MTKKKVHIIGGGIIGMSVAYHLADHADVTVYELDRSYSQSSFARSCGGLRAQFSTDTNILMSRYSINFIKEVTKIPFTGNGYLMLFDHRQQADHDQSIVLQQQLGAGTQSLNAQELESRYPYLNVSDVYRGCVTLDSSEGWIDPTTLHSWYREMAVARGVKIVYGHGLEQDHSSADKVVIAAGCWTGKVAEQLGISIPVSGQKHTVYHVTTERPVLRDLPLVADLITGIYLRPEGQGYIVGYDGNGEFDSDNLDPDYASWDTVWQLLYHRFPDYFDAAKVTGAWAGYYDVSGIDSNAIIDHRDQYYFATGFTGRGLMHSPAVGLTVKEMILEQSLSFDIGSYRLDRTPSREKYVI